jgi:hypothetical protein
VISVPSSVPPGADTCASANTTTTNTHPMETISIL